VIVRALLERMQHPHGWTRRVFRARLSL
jgi:hypothetical protein